MLAWSPRPLWQAVDYSPPGAAGFQWVFVAAKKIAQIALVSKGMQATVSIRLFPILVCNQKPID